MKILVTGSRNWPSEGIVRCALGMAIKEHYYPEKPNREDVLIIHGAARGADSLAAKWADDYRVPHTGNKYKIWPDEWNRIGKKAGVLRNMRMLDENIDTDIVLAFCLDNSPGTSQMIAYAKSKGKKVLLYEL